MRPVSLEMSGFMSYRDPTAINFESIDLFVLEGPTGSGKSSIIDAMLFSLYGEIPRHGGRSVRHVINIRKQEAKVRFDFTIGDDSFTAVRQVSTKGKASFNTDEARFLKNDLLLAESAKEMTAAVTEVLGLDFNQFISAVVLPQGQFANFLTEAPAKRQDILVHLLGMGIYEQVRDKTKEHRDQTQGKLDATENMLADLRLPTSEQVEEKQDKLKQLSALYKKMEKLDQTRAQLFEDGEQHEETHETLSEQLEQLGEVESPSGLDTLAAEQSKCSQTIKESKQREKTLAKKLSDLDKEIKQLPSYKELIDQQSVHRQLQIEQENQKELTAAEQEQTKKLATLELDLQEAQENQKSAEQELKQLQAHADADQFRTQLVVGKDCPVCGQSVTKIPKHRPKSAITTAQKQANLAKSEHAKTQQQVSNATAQLNQTAKNLKSTVAEIKKLEKKVDAELSPAKIKTHLQKLEKLDRNRAQQVEKIEAEQQIQTDSEHQLEEMEEYLQAAREELADRRDRLNRVGLEPVKVDPKNFQQGWKKLEEWATKTTTKLEADLAKTEDRLTQLNQKIEQVQNEITTICRDHSIKAKHGKELDAIGNQKVREEEQLKQWEKSKTQQAKWLKDLPRLEKELKLSEDLIQLLRANRFEAWAMGQALVWLTEGANERLGDISSGRYQLTKDDKNNFEVIDLFGESQRRPVSSLSGGERFLVSLAMALSLSDYLSQAPATGRSILQMFILDEGFGTLDADTLETIIPVVTELIKTENKMVGLVTHVQQLAEQIPTRILVSRDRKGVSSLQVENR